MKPHLKKISQQSSQKESRVNKFSEVTQNTQKTPRKKSLFNDRQTAELTEKKASEKTILKQHPSSLMFRNGDIDNYVVKSNNTSLSNIINNGTQSFLEEYKGSRLGDSLMKIKTSSQNQNTSFSKSTQQYRKSLLYGQSSNEEEKNSDYSLRSSVVMTFNPNGGFSNKNSKNDLPNYSSMGKFIFKQRSDRLLNLNNDPQLNADYYSQNRESFKASITSIPANNDNAVPVNLELSQSQILPLTNREGSQVANTVASTANLLTNQVSSSNVLNAGLSNRKNSDVVLSLNTNQANAKKPNFKRFTINYAVKEQEKHKIEVVSNVGEYCYLKQYKEIDQDIVRVEDEEIDCDIDEEEIKDPVNKNSVPVMEIKENALGSERDMINFNLLLHNYYSEEGDSQKLSELETTLRSLKNKIGVITKLDKQKKELSSKLKGIKRTLKTEPEDNLKEEDLDLIKEEISKYSKLHENKVSRYQNLIKKLKDALGEKAKNLIDIEAILSQKSNNNFVKSIRTSRNSLKQYSEPADQENFNLVTIYRAIDPSQFKFAVPEKYEIPLEGCAVKETKVEEDRSILCYENGVVETKYNNGTIKKAFDDGYSVYYFSNGDIKQTFPNRVNYYYYQKNDVYEFNFEKTFGYKIILRQNGQFDQVYANGTKISRDEPTGKVKITKGKDTVYY